MKQKKITQKFKFLLVTISFCFLAQLSFGANLIQYPLSTNSNSTPLGGSLTLSSSLTSITSFGSNGASASGWDAANQYWQISPISTIGYHTITVSAFMFSDATGPANFKVQYNVNSTGWNDAGSYVLTTITANTAITLPAACANKASVQVRWVNTDNKDVNGNPINHSSVSYIKTIKIVGSLPTTPDSQVQYITFVSITPTTITIDASPGSGDNRIAVINTINSFTDPVDDQIFTANPNYNYSSGDHQQVIYVGSGTQFTVTVPSSTNIYWVRFYEYNYNGGMTRYYTPEDIDNPNQCALETITPDPATLIRLTTATMGATISTPTRSSISERGIVWSTSPGVGQSDHKTPEGGKIGGSFTIPFSSLARGTRVYFKGYVTNVSGTIYSSESYFDNNPIFNGTGNWEDNTKWNVLQVPGSTGAGGYGNVADSPIINGNCTLTASNSVTNLTINSGKNLTINSATSLDVVGTLSNNSTSGILIKASASAANGSLKFASGNPLASVEMYSKANWNLSNPAGEKYKWQYFGIPVKTITAGNTFSGLLGNSASSSRYVREWDESSVGYFDAWVLGGDHVTVLYKTTGSTLDQNHGYELVQQNPTTYTFAGELLNTNYTQTLSYSPGAAFAGQHIFGNPYTAAVNIANIQFGPNTEQAVYLYNTGTFNDWSVSNGANAPGDGPGQYTVSTPGTAGQGGVPGQIPTAGSFLIKAINTTGSFTISKSTGLVANNTQMRSKGSNTLNSQVNTRIDLIGQKTSDRMWIFTFPNCTRSFDNGYDGKKILGDSRTTQLYSLESDGIYQINAVNDMNESYLGFQPGNETSFKLVFNHENTNSVYGSIYLIDLVANKTVDITQSGTEYSFTAGANDPTQRFKIVTQTTGTNTVSENNTKLKIYNTDDLIYVQNFSEKNATYLLYNVSGKLIQRINVESNSVKTINTNELKSGVYVAKAETETDKVTQRIIIR